MLKKIINKVSSKLGFANPANIKFPYIYHQVENDIYYHINNSIEEFRLKEWGGEKDYIAGMMSKLRTDDVFLDVGSSVGLISIIASKILTQGKVISIEPDPENRQHLELNYKLNKLNNYSIIQIAAGETKDKLLLYTSGSNGFSPSLKKVNGINTNIEVKVESVDNLLSEKKITHPTIIKIDIEGAELMALKGMRNLLLSKNKPRLIFIEIHPEFLVSFNTNPQEIFEFMAQFEYKLVEKLDRDKQILCEFISY